MEAICMIGILTYTVVLSVVTVYTYVACKEDLIEQKKKSK